MKRMYAWFDKNLDERDKMCVWFDIITMIAMLGVLCASLI